MTVERTPVAFDGDFPFTGWQHQDPAATALAGAAWGRGTAGATVSLADQLFPRVEEEAA